MVGLRFLRTERDKSSLTGIKLGWAVGRVRGEALDSLWMGKWEAFTR